MKQKLIKKFQSILPSWGPKDLFEFRTEVFAIFAVLAVGVIKKKEQWTEA